MDVETGSFLEMTPDNKKDTVKNTIKDMVGYNKNIEIITMDMSCGYRAHIEKIFGDSGVSKVKIIVDKFHVMQDLSRKVASTKTKLMAYRSDIIKHLSNEERWLPENDEMVYVYGALANDPWLFRFGYQKLSNDPARQKRMAVVSERLPEFNHLRLLKEGLERVYYEATDRAEAKKLLDEWNTLVPPVRNARSIEEWEKKYGVDAELFADFRSLQKTLISWENEILNYFEPNCQFTNAVSEGTNSAIQKINERGSGYEFKHLRAKALFGHVAIPRVRYDKKNLVSQISVSSYSPGNVGFSTFDTDFMKQKPMIIGIDFYSKPYENTLQPLSALDDSLLDVIF